MASTARSGDRSQAWRFSPGLVVSVFVHESKSVLSLGVKPVSRAGGHKRTNILRSDDPRVTFVTPAASKDVCLWHTVRAWCPDVEAVMESAE
jgi:hypothetical protein